MADHAHPIQVNLETILPILAKEIYNTPYAFFAREMRRMPSTLSALNGFASRPNSVLHRIMQSESLLMARPCRLAIPALG